MTPELRLLRYFVAVAEERNVTRAAEKLHMAQPPLSTAIRQLEAQLGVRLLDRSFRGVELTPAGELLLERGRELLARADDVFNAVRELERAPTGLLHVGITPTARFELGPALLAACAARVPGVMLRTREDTTGAMLRDLKTGRLDLAVTFCPTRSDGVRFERLRDEPAVAHLPADHPLAGRDAIALEELRDETILVAGGPDSDGYTSAVLALCRGAGFEPRTVPDPHPDLGVQAVRDRLGVVIYVRTAFGPVLNGTVLRPIAGTTLPFDLAWRPDARSGALAAVLDAARSLRMHASDSS